MAAQHIFIWPELIQMMIWSLACLGGEGDGAEVQLVSEKQRLFFDPQHMAPRFIYVGGYE